MRKPTAKSVEEVNIYLEGLSLRIPDTSTDNAVARFDGTGGALQNSGVTIDDSNNVNIAGLEFGSSGPRMMVDTGKVVLGTSTAAADPAKSLATKDYVDTGLPTISVYFEKSTWSAGTYTVLPMHTVYAAGNISSYNRDDWFYDLSTGSGKTYFRVRKRGLYLCTGVFGWNWSGDNYSMPISGVFRADVDQYIEFGIWLNQANGGPAASRCFGYPKVSGNAQTHVLGNVYMASAIGGSPANLIATLSFTRIGD